MPLVRVKGKSQITLPVALRRRFQISEVDVLEASSTERGILLTPKTVVDRSSALELKRGLDDLRHGRIVGPFKTAGELRRARATAAKRKV